MLETARVADQLGYDLLAIQDHPYQPAHLDALALAGVILGQTESIRVFQDVGNLKTDSAPKTPDDEVGSSRSGKRNAAA